MISWWRFSILIKGKTIYARMGDKTIVIDKHLIVDVFKIS